MPGSKVKHSKRRKKSPQPSSKSQTPPHEFEVSGAIYAVLGSALMYTKECRSLKGQADASPAVPKLLREVLSSVKKAEKRQASLRYDTNIAELTNFLIDVYGQLKRNEITYEGSKKLIDEAWAENGCWWTPAAKRPTTSIVGKTPRAGPKTLYLTPSQLEKPGYGPALAAYDAVGDMYNWTATRVRQIVSETPKRTRDWDDMSQFECLARFFVDIFHRPPRLVVDHIDAIMAYSINDPDMKSRLIARCQASWSSINADWFKLPPETGEIHAANSAPLVAPPKPTPNNARTSS